MASIKKIKKQIKVSNSLPENSDGVSAALFVNDLGYPFHAAIFVSRGEEKSVFHFDKSNLQELKSESCMPFLLKQFETILPSESGAFLVIIREALKNTAPGYNFYYDGGYYKKGGGFVDDNETPVYRMTCVGFCLGVLKGWFEGDDYIAHEDWKADETMSAEKITSELKKLQSIYPGFSEEELANSIRRIKPVEYLASAFVNDRPIRKSDTDKLKTAVMSAVQDWHSSRTTV